MAHNVVHSPTAKASIGDAILADIDAGAPASTLQLFESGTLRATLPLDAPSGTVNGTTGVITFECTTPQLEDTNVLATTGSGVDSAQFIDGNGVTILTCTAGIGATFDINLSNNIFGAGDTIQISSLSYTPPA